MIPENIMQPFIKWAQSKRVEHWELKAYGIYAEAPSYGSQKVRYHILFSALASGLYLEIK